MEREAFYSMVTGVVPTLWLIVVFQNWLVTEARNKGVILMTILSVLLGFVAFFLSLMALYFGFEFSWQRPFVMAGLSMTLCLTLATLGAELTRLYLTPATPKHPAPDAKPEKPS
jgi:hypothetical protein